MGQLAGSAIGSGTERPPVRGRVRWTVKVGEYRVTSLERLPNIAEEWPRTNVRLPRTMKSSRHRGRSFVSAGTRETPGKRLTLPGTRLVATSRLIVSFTATMRLRVERRFFFGRCAAPFNPDVADVDAAVGSLENPRISL